MTKAEFEEMYPKADQYLEDGYLKCCGCDEEFPYKDYLPMGVDELAKLVDWWVNRHKNCTMRVKVSEDV